MNVPSFRRGGVNISILHQGRSCSPSPQWVMFSKLSSPNQVVVGGRRTKSVSALLLVSACRGVPGPGVRDGGELGDHGDEQRRGAVRRLLRVRVRRLDQVAPHPVRPVALGHVRRHVEGEPARHEERTWWVFYLP